MTPGQPHQATAAVTVGLCVCAALLLSGCTASTTGALRLGKDQLGQVEAYQQFKAQRDAAARKHAAAQQPTTFQAQGAQGKYAHMGAAGDVFDDQPRMPRNQIVNQENGNYHQTAIALDGYPNAGTPYRFVNDDAPQGSPTMGQSAPAPGTPGGQNPSRQNPGGQDTMGLFGQAAGDAWNTRRNPGRSSPLEGPDNLRRISFTTEGADFDPVLDPTGQFIVYASTRHRERADLYMKRVDGTAVTQLTFDPGQDRMPTISPDGKKVAFASNRSGNWNIYLMNTEGGKAMQLTDDPSHEIHPSFSRDGTKLAYCMIGQQSGQWELVILDLNNPAQRRFIGFGLFPNFSPTQDKLVYQRARERGTRWFSVWTMDLEDGQGVRPTEIAASANAACITPDWSPDGRHVVFCTVIDPTADGATRPAQADVWMTTADGRSRINLTNSRFTNLQPTWAPDGTIFFVSDRSQSGVENIWATQPRKALRLVSPTPTRTNTADGQDPEAQTGAGTSASVPTP